jgi:hypothetical protein
VQNPATAEFRFMGAQGRDDSVTVHGGVVPGIRASGQNLGLPVRADGNGLVVGCRKAAVMRALGVACRRADGCLRLAQDSLPPINIAISIRYVRSDKGHYRI